LAILNLKGREREKAGEQDSLFLKGAQHKLRGEKGKIERGRWQKKESLCAGAPDSYMYNKGEYVGKRGERALHPNRDARTKRRPNNCSKKLKCGRRGLSGATKNSHNAREKGGPRSGEKV